MPILPAIVFDERRLIDVIQHLLRSAQPVNLVAETLVNTSPRIKQPLKRFDNGERVIVTIRRHVALPEGVDGVLYGHEGECVWAEHRLLVALVAQAFGWGADLTKPDEHKRECALLMPL